MKLLFSKFLFDGEVLLKDYAVIIHNNVVIDVGAKNVLEKVYSVNVNDFGDGVLFPGFVNLHTHLELSYLKNKLPRNVGFVKWLEGIMLEKRKPVDVSRIKLSLKEAAQELYENGVRIVGDISNTLASCNYLRKCMPNSVVFFELYGLSKDRACYVKNNFKNELKRLKPKCGILRIIPTAHSLYSTHTCLAKYLAKLNKNEPFSIHFLESIYEKEFLNSKGELFEFLYSSGLIDEGLKYDNVLDYIRSLGLYRKNIIFVHCVDVQEKEISQIKSINATVCLCLRSNDYISGVLPDVYALDRSGINIGIGTDSLASNWDLNFVNELRFIYKKFERLNPATIFKWAVDGGSQALKINFGFKKGYVAYDVFFRTNSNNNPLEDILGSEDNVPVTQRICNC